MDVTILQSPIHPRDLIAPVPRPTTYPQILHNVGFGDRDTCESILRGWDALIRFVHPDLLLADHSPGALLACHQSDLSVVVIGTGFVIPPAVCPMPSLITDPALRDERRDHQRSIENNDEQTLLANVQAVNERMGRQGPSRLCDIFSGPDDQFLTTSKILDHYPNRDCGHHYGAIQANDESDHDVPWPDGSGPRVFGYLDQCRALGHLFDHLRRTNARVLIHCKGMDLNALQELATPNLRFTNQPLPIDKITSECDLALLNGTHAMTSAMLFAGRPILQIPHHLEQLITANRTAELGAGLVADRNDGARLVDAFENLLNDAQFSNNAQKMADPEWFNQSSKTVILIANEIIRRVT